MIWRVQKFLGDKATLSKISRAVIFWGGFSGSSCGCCVGTKALLTYHITSGQPSHPQQRKQHFSNSLLLIRFRHVCQSELKLLGGLVSIPLGSLRSWGPLQGWGVLISIPLQHDGPGQRVRGTGESPAKLHPEGAHVGGTWGEMCWDGAGRRALTIQHRNGCLWFHGWIDSTSQDQLQACWTSGFATWGRTFHQGQRQGSIKFNSKMSACNQPPCSAWTN